MGYTPITQLEKTEGFHKTTHFYVNTDGTTDGKFRQVAAETVINTVIDSLELATVVDNLPAVEDASYNTLYLLKKLDDRQHLYLEMYVLANISGQGRQLVLVNSGHNTLQVDSDGILYL